MNRCLLWQKEAPYWLTWLNDPNGWLRASARSCKLIQCSPKLAVLATLAKGLVQNLIDTAAGTSFAQTSLRHVQIMKFDEPVLSSKVERAAMTPYGNPIGPLLKIGRRRCRR